MLRSPCRNVLIPRRGVTTFFIITGSPPINMQLLLQSAEPLQKMRSHDIILLHGHISAAVKDGAAAQ